MPVEKAYITEADIANQTGETNYEKLQNYIAGNKVYPMAIQLSDGSYKGILYDFEEGTDGVTVTPKDYTTTNSYREPDVVTSYDSNTTYLDQINGILNTSYSSSDDFKNALQIEFNEMVRKVNTNKGFWVGRYETSNMSDSTTTTYDVSNEIQVGVKKGTTNGINSVTWYRMYAQQKSYSNLALTQSGVTSSMIWGSQWDQIMIWMRGTRNESQSSYYVINAVGMGNYGVADADDYDDTSNPAETGYYDVKNIYDLAGNVYDWSLEAYNTSYRVLRRRLLRLYE